MAKILVIDDEQTICWGLSRLCEGLGHDVTSASSAEQALQWVQREKPDLIVTDVRLPGMDGLTSIPRFRQLVGEVPIIVMTAYGDLQTAVSAVREGAFEYILKPFDLNQVEQAIVRALTSNTVGETIVTPSQRHTAGLVGNTPAMQQVFKRIAFAAGSDACVLVTGESGTGKELAARAIHRFSRRADKPFVAVNVAALSPTLAESELFGHVRGSFTGAEQSRVGLLVQADGGTLFLDEVADIPLPTQVKLLRVLEQGEVTPVGSNEAIRSDFRVIAATHRNLAQLVDQGTFRHDLFYRLCAFQVDMPPLRRRADDIPAIAEHFFQAWTAKNPSASLRLSPEAVEELKRRPWHGNVRELRNVLEHAAILARGGVILSGHLPETIQPGAEPKTRGLSTEQQVAEWIDRWARAALNDPNLKGQLYDRMLALVEPSLFRVLLEKNNNQCAAAARWLGLHRTTLRKKLDQYGIEG